MSLEDPSSRIGHPVIEEVSPWVRRWLPTDGRGRHCLDFACGGGRHARLALSLHYEVLAVDHDAQALAQLAQSCLPQVRGLRVVQEDVESGRWTFSAERFDVIVQTRFLHRERMDLLPALLKPGGRLIVETFGDGNAHHGRPRRPEFLLRSGELADWAHRAGLLCLAFEQGFVAAPSPAIVQRILAIRPPVDERNLRLDQGC